MQQGLSLTASGPSPSSVGTPGSGNAIKPLIARQYYITGGSVAVAAEGCFARCCFQWHLRFNHVAFKSRLPCVASSIACNVFFFIFLCVNFVSRHACVVCVSHF